MIGRISWIAAFLLCGISARAEDGKPIRVFVLAGQSNMDGRGDGSKLTADDEKRLAAASGRVGFAYNGTATVPLRVTTPESYIARKFGLTRCFGPELFFGIHLVEAYPDERFLLIKRSKGGTSLYGCWNPEWSEEKAKVTDELAQPKLYSQLEADIDAAIKDLPKDGYQFCGMLWVQGEADGGVEKFGPEPAATYAENLTILIRSIREHTHCPDLPFVLLEVGAPAIRAASRQVTETVDRVQTIPQSADPSSPNHLPGYGPPVGHYNYEGMKRIGELFFETFQQNYPIPADDRDER